MKSNLEKPSKTLLRDLGFISVKYIIYQANTTLSCSEILDNLLSQNDLQLVFHKKSIWIFENKLFQPFIRSPNQSVILNYVKVNPTKWIVNVKAESPFILIFSEPNDKNWEAFIGEKKLAKIQVCLLSTTMPSLNTFLVNETGQFTITIEYKPQKYMDIGAYVSVVTLLLLSIVYFKLSICTQGSNHGKH